MDSPLKLLVMTVKSVTADVATDEVTRIQTAGVDGGARGMNLAATGLAAASRASPYGCGRTRRGP